MPRMSFCQLIKTGEAAGKKEKEQEEEKKQVMGGRRLTWKLTTAVAIMDSHMSDKADLRRARPEQKKPTPGIIRSTSAVDTITHARLPACVRRAKKRQSATNLFLKHLLSSCHLDLWFFALVSFLLFIFHFSFFPSKVGSFVCLYRSRL